MNHILKIWPQYFARVKDGSKTFEVRKNDRGFQKGDTVLLAEWDPTIADNGESDGFTGHHLEFKIGYVLPINESEVVFSLLSNLDCKLNSDETKESPHQ